MCPSARCRSRRPAAGSRGPFRPRRQGRAPLRAAAGEDPVDGLQAGKVVLLEHDAGAAQLSDLEVKRYLTQALSASLSSVSIRARLARQPAGDGEFASRLYLLAVSKQRVIGVMITTCGVERGSDVLK